MLCTLSGLVLWNRSNQKKEKNFIEKIEELISMEDTYRDANK